MRLTIYCFFIVLIAACSSPTEKTFQSQPDLPLLVQTSVAHYRQQHFTIQKQLVFGGKKDEVMLKDTPDWQTELESFSTVDLNKPAYQGALLVQPERQEGFFLVKTLIGKQPLELDTCELFYRGDHLCGFQVVYQGENVLYASVKKLVFFEDSLYEISGTQRTRLMKPVYYYVKGMVIKRM